MQKILKIDLTVKDCYGRTGFQIALSYGKNEVVNLIRRKKPSIAYQQSISVASTEFNASNFLVTNFLNFFYFLIIFLHLTLLPIYLKQYFIEDLNRY